MGVQPVEAIRVLVVLFLAGYFANRWEFLRALKEPRVRGDRLRLDIPRLDYLLPVVIGMALVLLFFFLQKDLGPAMVLACVFLALYGVARGRTTMVAVGPAGAGRRLRGRLRHRLPAHGGAARADVVVALGQPGARRRSGRARAVGVRHRRGRRHRHRPGRLARHSGRAHRPDPRGRRRGNGARRPAGGVRAQRAARLPRPSDCAPRPRRLHAVPVARPHARDLRPARADLGGHPRPAAADGRHDAVPELRPVVDDRELLRVRRAAGREPPVGRRGGEGGVRHADQVDQHRAGRRRRRRRRARSPTSRRSRPTRRWRPRRSPSRPTACGASSTTRA